MELMSKGPPHVCFRTQVWSVPMVVHMSRWHIGVHFLLNPHILPSSHRPAVDWMIGVWALHISLQRTWACMDDPCSPLPPKRCCGRALRSAAVTPLSLFGYWITLGRSVWNREGAVRNLRAALRARDADDDWVDATLLTCYQQQVIYMYIVV